MASRMERYYKPESKTKRRTVANQELYRKIYDISEYSNIEGIATIDKANEIDITKVKNMLKNREEYQRQKDLRSLIYKEEPKVQHIETMDSFEEDRIYDISDALLKAKQENKENSEKYRNLGNTNYNILKSLQVKKELDEQVSEADATTNTRVLNDLTDNTLSLDLLGDLKSNTGTIVSNKTSIQQLLEQAKEEEIKKNEQTRKQELDKSFFTSSLNFGKEDFEEVNNVVPKKSKKGLFMKIGLILSLIFITIGIIILVYMLIK